MENTMPTVKKIQSLDLLFDSYASYVEKEHVDWKPVFVLESSEDSDDESEYSFLDSSNKHDGPTFKSLFYTSYAAPIKMKKDYQLERQGQRLLQNEPELCKKNSYIRKFSVYFTPLKKKENKLSIIDNEFVFKGRYERKPNGKYTYIVDLDGNLIVSDLPGVHHSHLANGKKVKAAGDVWFEDGQLVRIDNSSGHYKPTMLESMDVLCAINYELDNCEDIIFIDYSNVASGELKSYPLGELMKHKKDDRKLENVDVLAKTEHFSFFAKTPAHEKIRKGYTDIKSLLETCKRNEGVDVTMGGAYNC
jgi:hypothetical protein